MATPQQEGCYDQPWGAFYSKDEEAGGVEAGECEGNKESNGHGHEARRGRTWTGSMSDMAGFAIASQAVGAAVETVGTVSQAVGDQLSEFFSEQRGVFADVEDFKNQIKEGLKKPAYNVADFYHKTGIWPRIATHTVFENLTLGVIAFNALWIAIDTDNNDADMLLDAKPVFQVVENFFCFYFSFEWFVRFMSFKLKRNCLRDAWFVFDSTLVFMMVMETWALSIFVLLTSSGGGGSPMGNASILRLFRLLRLSRMARMLRSMPELMILIKGMVAATRSVFFTMLLLTLVLYVFAIITVQLGDGTEAGLTYFPTIPAGMYTLLMHGTFLEDVAKVADVLAGSSPVLVIVFYVCVAISALMVMNMLIGVLCEVVSAVATVEKEEMTVAFVKEKMKKIVLAIDEDDNGKITKAEFGMILKHKEAVRMLDEIGVDPVGLVGLADFIFAGEDGEDLHLDFGKFMEVVLDLRGSNLATVKDVMNMTKYVRNTVARLEDSFMATVRRDSFHAALQRFNSLGVTKQPSVESQAQHKRRNSLPVIGTPSDAASGIGKRRYSLPVVLPGAAHDAGCSFQDSAEALRAAASEKTIAFQPSSRDRSRSLESLPAPPLPEEVRAAKFAPAGRTDSEASSPSSPKKLPALKLHGRKRHHAMLQAGAPNTLKLESFVSSAQDELKKFRTDGSKGKLATSRTDSKQFEAWASRMEKVLSIGIQELQRLRSHTEASRNGGNAVHHHHKSPTSSPRTPMMKVESIRPGDGSFGLNRNLF